MKKIIKIDYDYVTTERIINPNKVHTNITNTVRIGGYANCAIYPRGSLYYQHCVRTEGRAWLNYNGTADLNYTQWEVITSSTNGDIPSLCQDPFGNVGIGIFNGTQCAPKTLCHCGGNSTIDGFLYFNGSAPVLGLSLQPVSPQVAGFVTGPVLQVGDTNNPVTRIVASQYIDFFIEEQATMPLFNIPGMQVLISPFGFSVASFSSSFGTFTPSDQRIKTGIVPFGTGFNYTARFMNFNPVLFNYTAQYCAGFKNCKTTTQQHGFIAQQIEAIDPSLISKAPYSFIDGTTIPDLTEIKPDGIITYLVKVLQDQVLINQNLLQRVSALEARSHNWNNNHNN